VTNEPRDEIAIDWESAAVDDGRLTVALTGKPTSDWTGRVEHVVDRLERPSNAWGKIKVTKKAIRVDDVNPGSESELHHFLESAVLQANADLRSDEDAPSGEERSEDDQRMTDAFRSYAAQESEG
jgi:hypothetical protein